MSPKKTKNLIILILVLVNLFLLALVVPNKLAEQRKARMALTKLSQLYEASGIHLDAAILPEEKTLYPLTVMADDEAQRAAIRALLGKDMTRKPEKDATLFTSDLGEAKLQDGVLSASLNLPAGNNPLSFTRTLLEQMEVSFAYLQETKTMSGSIIAARLQVQDTTVFNESLIFTYENGNLTAVTGLLLPNSSTLYAAGSTPGLGLWDALVRFRSSRITTGWMGSSVTSVEQGYLLSAAADGRSFSLTPQWRMETDMGPYLVDGANGAVSAAS